MISIKFTAGLGNQMFQYAFYLQLLSMGKKVNVFLDVPSAYNASGIDIFDNVKFDEAVGLLSQLSRVYNKTVNPRVTLLYRFLRKSGIIYIEDTKQIVDDVVFSKDKGVIEGYFINERYFKDVAEKVRNAFEFPYGERKLQEFVERLNKNSVSIHIRRGDYLKQSEIYGGICTEKYYHDSMQYMQSITNPGYVIFSDDIGWVKKNFKVKNAIFVSEDMFDEYKDWYDMYIMSRCTHNIIANSTFSWWGAWLNKNSDKIVISPPISDNKNKKCIACKTWMLIKG